MNLEGIRLLLVEDNPADARLLREVMVEAGAGRIDLVHVNRLSQALERVAEEDFDVILLDLSLPDEDGLQTLVRLHARAASVPIVVLTGLDDEALAVKAVREGAQDYLIKGKVDSNLLLRSMRYATERKRAIETLQRNEEHFRSLIENALDLISILNPDGAIRYISPSHERILGYGPEEMIGANFFSFVHSEDLAGLRGSLREPTGTRSLEFRFRHKSGGWRVLESFSRNLSHVPSVQGIVVNSRDITERKQVEDALREANQTLRAVIQTSPLAIYATDLQGRVQSWNRAAHRTFGWAEWEVLDQPAPHLPGTPEEALRARLEQAGRHDNELGFETTCRRKDGSEVPVTIWSAELRDASSAVKGIVDVVADVTEHKRLQAQLLHSQRLEAVGRLAGGVAHDFNNLLMVITGYARILSETLHPADPARADLEQVMKATDRATSLTSQLLTFSRRQIVSPRVIDLNALVGDMDRMLRRVIGEDIELTAVLVPGLHRIRADSGQIEQVILNLVVNARDAMPRGGKLTIETRNIFFDESHVRKQIVPNAGHYAMLAIRDTGVGVPPEVKAHLFEPFFTTKEKGKGTGLGLSTSYGIVKQNNGEIHIHSEPGDGAVVEIYLPMALTETDAAEPRRENPSLSGNETILLVEDDIAVLQVLEAMLKRRGYEVLSASSPSEALAVAKVHAGPIDLIVTDVVMTGMSGPELADQIRASLPGLQVLYVSGYPETLNTEQTTPFLQKPFPPEALALKVREVLGARKSMAEA